jgi:hypothetical protein
MGSKGKKSGNVTSLETGVPARLPRHYDLFSGGDFGEGGKTESSPHGK